MLSIPAYDYLNYHGSASGVDHARFDCWKRRDSRSIWRARSLIS